MKTNALSKLTPAPGELAHLAAVIFKGGKDDLTNPVGDDGIAAINAIDLAWMLFGLAAKRIDRHQAEEAERERLEAERLSGLVPFDNVKGYKKPMPFEMAVRRALHFFGEPLPPTDYRFVVDGFVLKSHVEFLQRYNRELARERQGTRRERAKEAAAAKAKGALAKTGNKKGSNKKTP
jgi:hypothetical protein